MKRLPVGRQNFEAIIKENLLYVDKTRQMYELICTGNLYFLSRPRRFGKSLLVSKLKHLFSGNKELFEGLYIHEQTNYDWQPYPVIQFNFAKLGQSVEHLESGIRYLLKQHAEEFNIQLPDTTLSLQFDYLIKSISQKGKPVVLLIDEYDKPIVDFLTEVEKAKRNQNVLKDFFSPLKDLDAQGHIRFLFITGVSKFSKVSLFSDLNNLTDLTIDRLSDDLLGITQDELLTYFTDYIKIAVEHFELKEEQLLKDIKFWYNGYAYNPEIKLYNPFSLLNFFNSRRFGNFWFATGTPTFLVNSIRDQIMQPQELENIKVPETFFDKYSLEKIDIVGLLFQTGYLTIKTTETKRHRTKYFLGYPNEEVRLSMVHNLVEAFTYKRSSTVGNALLRMEDGLEEGNVKTFIEQLEILLSDISYHLLPKKKDNKQTEFEIWEGYFHTIIYLVTSFMGFHVQSEITKHKGRLDLLVETDDYIYIMEFKLDEPAKNAIQQIKNRKYAAGYRNSSKTIYLVGIGFSREERNVEGFEVEVWER
ncbi:MAG: ATP-binding protein [Bacteroidetes bacterium]|nr:ATP-binding protein [Bacteroidota bacterium]